MIVRVNNVRFHYDEIENRVFEIDDSYANDIADMLEYAKRIAEYKYYDELDIFEEDYQDELTIGQIEYIMEEIFNSYEKECIDLILDIVEYIYDIEIYNVQADLIIDLY